MAPSRGAQPIERQPLGPSELQPYNGGPASQSWAPMAITRHIVGAQ